MEKLYAPWRSLYVKGVHDNKNDHAPSNNCVFCEQFKQEQDTKNYILRRFAHTVVMLNLYPYNAGHILILPREHHKTLNAMSKDARAELMEVTNAGVEILTTILGAEGNNVGINLGKSAGAGIPEHLHIHIVPRWRGDTNFLPVIAQTKQISIDLNEIYQKLLPAFAKTVI